MATPPVCDFGWAAPDFALPGTDGQTHALEQVRGPKGTLIMFICNHCPYVTGAIERIVSDARAIREFGIGIAAICSNDATSYPQDSFANMVRFALEVITGFPTSRNLIQSARLITRIAKHCAVSLARSTKTIIAAPQQPHTTPRSSECKD